ncbi:hypothetical protein TNCV_566841 [Trichonephila clavipes]|nr:hypothetical protein TNCV_566841 [Trichonephila clavipes]
MAKDHPVFEIAELNHEVVATAGMWRYSIKTPSPYPGDKVCETLRPTHAAPPAFKLNAPKKWPSIRCDSAFSNKSTAHVGFAHHS